MIYANSCIRDGIIAMVFNGWIYVWYVLLKGEIV